MSLKEILQTATYFFVILTRNAVCVRRETGLFGVVCNCSGTGYPVFATVYASNAALTYLMPREDDRVAIFRMDKDQFRRQIAELEQAGAEYEGAKASLSSAVGNSCQDLQNTGACTPSDDDRWSGLNELQQFRAPVHTSLFAVDKEMKQLSELQKATIEDLRSSLDSFTYRDDAERAEFAAALDRLDRQFTYTPPQGMGAIAQALWRGLRSFPLSTGGQSTSQSAGGQSTISQALETGLSGAGLGPSQSGTGNSGSSQGATGSGGGK